MTSSLKVITQPVTAFQQNCSVIWCRETNKAAIIDPGGDLYLIEEILRENHLILEKILLTHGHLDHAGGAHDLSKTYQVPIIGPHKEDLFLLESIEVQGRDYGLSGCKSCLPSVWLDQGDVVTIGSHSLEVYHCPGHTPGHIVFFHRHDKIAFVGDVLFKGSIGRTDFPRGNYQRLIDSITMKLWPLGNDVIFVPGHGDRSSFGQERYMNPFVSDSVLNQTT
jgi:glyoxylase-like metal-dependent hydrolase (beta-lactamase superfamily II)